MSEYEKLTVFWFRRDLRLQDQTGLYHALRSGFRVLPVFIFDTVIVKQLEPDDRRMSFIYQALEHLDRELSVYGSKLHVAVGEPLAELEKITGKYPVQAVYCNHDYEPYAVERDAKVSRMLAAKGISFHGFKDQVIFEKDDVTTNDGRPYTTYTLFSNKWFARFHDDLAKDMTDESLFNRFVASQRVDSTLPSLKDVGFHEQRNVFVSPSLDHGVVSRYELNRDIPSLDASTHLGVHLRFGTVSIRSLIRQAMQLSHTWVKELQWREFFMQILWHYPAVVDGPFRKEYTFIPWRNDTAEFERWCHGQTGYPIVDAGMRELNATGFMHNRVRMITASFLTKHLLVDWRWGEQYFASRLMDFELASNNGNWQWVAGTGCDSAPYFRIFNPALQTEKFDPGFDYIRKWVPEFASYAYPKAMVDHAFARERCLKAYARARKEMQ